MIEKAHVDKVGGYIDSGVAEGADMVLGGVPAATGLDGHFVEPIILAGVTNDMTVARQEKTVWMALS